MERERKVSKDVIVCQNISKSFDTARGVVDVIRKIDLYVRKNEMLVLFGPDNAPSPL